MGFANTLEPYSNSPELNGSSPSRVSMACTHQIRRGRRAARLLTSQGKAEPLCARIESANREVSEGKADL